MEVHEKIIEEIVSEYKSESLAINVMGSVARGNEHENSDLDIEIVTPQKERSFSFEQKKRYSIKIDFVISSRGQIEYQINNYPFFLLQYDKRIVYDPEGFMKNIKKRDLEYKSANPEVSNFWEVKTENMLKAKRNNLKKEKLHDIYDEAEIRFSKDHKITRDWFQND